MENRINALLLFCLCTLTVYASKPIEYKITGSVYHENRFVVGSPFYHKAWVEADLLLTNGEVINDQLMRYNGLIDKFVWLNTVNYKQTIVDEFFVKEYRLTDELGVVHIFKQLDVRDSNPYLDDFQFVELLHDGNSKLYKSHRVIAQWPQYKIVDQIRLKYDVLKYTPSYYLQLADGKVLFLGKLDKRTVLKTFVHKKKEINSFLRTSKLKLKNQYDFILLFENVF